MTDTPSPEAIAEALREATPGPWEATYSHDILADISAPGRKINAVVYDDEGRALHANVYAPTRYDGILPDDDDRRTNPHTNWRADAHLIANAPTWLAQLLAALEAKDGEVARLREAWHRSFTMLRATYPHPDHVPLVVERVIDMMAAALAPSTPKEGE